VDQTQHEFVAEIEDLLEQLFDDLYKLREKPEPRLQRSLLDAVFRGIHSIKGSASSIGLDRLGEIAHQFENLLDAVRLGRLKLDDTVLDAVEDSINAISEALNIYRSETVPPLPLELLERIRRLISEESLTKPDDFEAILSQLPSEIWQSLNESEKSHAQDVIKEGANLLLLSTNFDIADFDRQFYSLKENLAELGEIISTSPTVDPEHKNKINFRILFASDSSPEELATLTARFPAVTTRGLMNCTIKNRSSRAALEVPEEQEARPIPDTSRSNAVRLDLNELDRLISSTHELFQATSTAIDLAQSNCVDAQAQEAFAAKATEIRRSFMAVEDQIINLRMVSVDRILKHTARVGRAAAQIAHKDIEFEIRGSGLRLDKLLCNIIADPLQHLVRNAVDHGIESREERVLKGKRPRGTVLIEIGLEDGRTRVRVTDDGRGVDPEIVGRAAAQLGLIQQGAELDMEGSLRLIFRPGFSTASAISSVSGRGVGLDVVETATEQVGGEVRVSSEPGRGSSFEICLPVTFGLLHATVLVSAGNRYCLDASVAIASEIASCTLIERGELGEAIKLHNEILPLVSLRRLLGQPPSDCDSRELHVVTCRLNEKPEKRDRQVAIAVDDVDGEQEVLVRNLGSHAVRWPGIAGATELPDGTIALVLDLPRLLNSSLSN